MWRLKIGDGGKSPCIFNTNKFVGWQILEFDFKLGTNEEWAQVEDARQHFYQQCRLRYQKRLQSLESYTNFWVA